MLLQAQISRQSQCTMPPQMNQNLQVATNSFPPRVESRTLVGQMEVFEVSLLVVRLMPHMSGMQLIERVSYLQIYAGC